MIVSQSRLIVGPEMGKHFNMGDVGMDFKIRSGEIPSGVAVHEWELGSRKLSSPPHKHEHEDEVFYVLRGEVTVMQDENVATAGPGSYVVLPRGHFHTFWNAGDVPARMLVILSPGRLEQYFEKASQLIQPGAPPDLAQLGQLVQEYGLTIQFERMPELMAQYGLESDVPLPGGRP
jgi:mannose-6-phosphate isomerase-like protein (cupin superfamily)